MFRWNVSKGFKSNSGAHFDPTAMSDKSNECQMISIFFSLLSRYHRISKKDYLNLSAPNTENKQKSSPHLLRVLLDTKSVQIDCTDYIIYI